MSDNEHEPSAERAIELAAEHRISGYDAQFVAAALELGVVCVTEDRELQNRLPTVAVSMKDFVAKASGGAVVGESKAVYRTRRRRPAR